MIHVTAYLSAFPVGSNPSMYERAAKFLEIQRHINFQTRTICDPISTAAELARGMRSHEIGLTIRCTQPRIEIIIPTLDHIRAISPDGVRLFIYQEEA